jgi:hypothetical protein
MEQDEATEGAKRRERGEEAKDIEKNSKPNNPRFSQRKNGNIHGMIKKDLNRARMIAMTQGKSNKVRWRDKGDDHCGCVIERRAVSNEESKEQTHND